MTTKTDLLMKLRLDWRREGKNAAAREACELLKARHPDLHLDSLEDLGGVVELLESTSSRNVVERANLVNALLLEAGNRSIHRALLQALLPGVVSVCRQLRFGEGIIEEPSDTLSTAISLLSELLVDWAGQSRQYAAPDLLSALRGRLRRWMLKEKFARNHVTHDSYVDESAQEASPLLTRLENLRGGEYDRLAHLTYARVFEGRSLRELAASDHSAPVSLQSELRHFALHHLL